MRTPLFPRPRRAALVLAAGALLATVATACEPPPPPAAFTVVPAATGADATPGDGVCENAGGDCSLQAAIEEANALDTSTEIIVPDGDVAAADLTVTGAITLLAGGATQDLDDVSWTIAEGAQVSVTDAQLGPVQVDGTLLARRVGLGAGDAAPISGVDALVEVGATGTVLLTNVQTVAWGAPLLINAGVASLHGTSISPPNSLTAAPTITTLAGGQTRFSANAFLSSGNTPPTCGGEAPVSYGYNLAPDTTCGLTMTGDRQDFVATGFLPPLGQNDPRVDAVPVGTLHCGSGWDDDATTPEPVRPSDGNLDQVVACDIGAREIYPPR